MIEEDHVPVVDGHVHLFKAVTDAYPRVVHEGLAPAGREELADQLIDVMDATGVDHAVVVPLSHHDQYLAQILTDFPGRFAGVGLHDFAATDPVADLGRRIEEVGIQGLRFLGFGAEPNSDPEAMRVFPLLETMRDHDLKVWFYGPLDQVRMLDKAMDLLPDLKVVMNHLAFAPDINAAILVDEFRRPRFNEALPPPSLETMERLAAKHESMFVHISGHYAYTREPYPYRELKEVVNRIYMAFGADRMLMASDWPWIQEEPGYANTLALVDDHLPGLTSEERVAIRGGTAMTLFHF